MPPESLWNVAEQLYDPMIVDKFLSVYRELAPEDHDAAQAGGPGLSAITRVALPVDDGTLQPTALDDIAASTEEMLVLYGLPEVLPDNCRSRTQGT